LNLYDFKKRTPLILAAANNHFEISKLLLDSGANPYYEDVDKQKPVEVCKNEVLKKLIQDYMENVLFLLLSNAST